MHFNLSYASIIKHIKWLAYFFIISFFLVFILNIEWDKIIEHVLRLEWKILIIILISGLSYFTASIAWHFSFKNLGSSPGPVRLFLIRQIGESLGVVTPANVLAGDAFKAWLLNKSRIPLQESLTSVFLSRMMLIISMIFIVIALMISLFIFSSFESGILVSLIIMIFIYGGLFLLFLHKKLWFFRISYYLLKKSTNTHLRISLWYIYRFNKNISQFYFQYPKRFLLVFLLSLMHWFIGSFEFYYLLQMLGNDITVFKSLIMEAGVISAKNLFAFIPGQLGIEEYTNHLMLQTIGLKTAGLWLIVSIIRRIRQLFWIGIGGLAFLYFKKTNH